MRKIVRGDMVVVISGKDKGKRGRVIKVFPKENKVVVEGVNIVKKHVRPTQQNPQGGVIDVLSPLHISKVMLVCPNCSTPTRVGIRGNGDRKFRFCKKCGKEIEK